MKTKIVCFGEIMGRFAPEGFLRLRQAMPGRLEFTFAGAEANVAASIAMLGGQSSFVTALPQNPIGEACLATLPASREYLALERGRAASQREGR